MAENRYIRFRCPLCVIKGIESVSPVCDQQDGTEGVRRDVPRAWWSAHCADVHPYPPPIIERVESMTGSGRGQNGELDRIAEKLAEQKADGTARRFDDVDAIREHLGRTTEIER